MIYYYHSVDLPIFLLTVFAKNERDHLTRAECNVLRELTTELVTAYQRRPANEPRTQRR